MPKAPIAFFAYKRPSHALKSLESLSRCVGADESELFIFCDGPKRDEDAPGVAEVRKAVKRQRWCGKVTVIEREKNLGLANSIIGGVTDLCEKYGRVIVVEDDLILSVQFLNYMNDALEVYKDIPKVMHIAGYVPPIKKQLPETFFYRATSCWGWATWNRAWKKFEPDAKKLVSRLSDKKMRLEFDVNGSMNFYSTLKDNADGRLKTWAVLWYASVFLEKGLCLHPGVSLVNNIGHDNTGVHCRVSKSFDVEIGKKRVNVFNREVREDEYVLSLLQEFYNSINKGQKTVVEKFFCELRKRGWI